MGIESLIETDIPKGFSLGVGTLTITAGNITVTGIGTAFLTDLESRDVLYYTDDLGNVQYLIVKFIITDTSLQAAYAPLAAATAVPFTLLPGSSFNTFYFIGDNTKKKMPILSPNKFALPLVSRYSSGAVSKFSINEGVLVKSIYLRLPYQFTLASNTAYVAFYYYLHDTDSYQIIPSIGEGVIDSFGVDLPLTIPFTNENVEIPLNAYVPPPGAGPWSIAAKLLITDIFTTFSDLSFEYASVSQIDAPDSLNSIILPVHIGARIEHTSKMT
jgi:hypothetical protein